MNLKWGAMVVVYSVSNRLSGNIDGRQQGLLLQATIGEADLRPPQSLTGGAMARATQRYNYTNTHLQQGRRKGNG